MDMEPSLCNAYSKPRKQKTVLGFVVKMLVALFFPILVSGGLMLYISGGSISQMPALSQLQALVKNGVAASKSGISSAQSSLNLSSNPQVTVYKWQDDNGVWHYSSEKPEHVVEEVTVNSNANLIQAVDASSVQPEEEEKPQKPHFGRIGQEESKTNGADGEGNIVEQVQNMLNNMQNRNSSLDDI